MSNITPVFFPLCNSCTYPRNTLTPMQMQILPSLSPSIPPPPPLLSHIPPLRLLFPPSSLSLPPPCLFFPRAKVSAGGMTAIPAYSYPGLVSGLPMDQTGLRPTYPFMIPGQYVQVPYQHQVSSIQEVCAYLSATPSNLNLYIAVLGVDRVYFVKLA